MKPILLVALGGAIGSVARFKLSGLILQQIAANWRFPLGTFVVNVIGCLLIGILSGLIVKQDLFPADIRAFLITGIIGGFTTFSAFELESFYLLRRGEILVAGSYIGLSVIVGIIILWIGFSVIPYRN